MLRSNISEELHPGNSSSGFAVGLAIAIALFYAPYAVEAVTAEASREVLALDRATEYDHTGDVLLSRRFLGVVAPLWLRAKSAYGGGRGMFRA